MKKNKYPFAFLGLSVIFLLFLSPFVGLAFAERQFDGRSELRAYDFREDLGLLRDKSFAQDRIMVQFKNDSRPYRSIRVPNGHALSVVKSYRERNDVLLAEPDYIAQTDFVPNDPLYDPFQWNLDSAADRGIRLQGAWDISRGDPSVIVAVVDTGVAYAKVREGRNKYEQAPELSDTCFVDGFDFVNNDPYPSDDQGHGTHVAGTIAQDSNNNEGAAGVAPETCIMPVKVLDASGSGYYSDIVDGIYYAVDNGADIINLSLGGAYNSAILESAVAYAYEKGVTVVAAAGNDNTSSPHYPASYNEYVISVGATGYDMTRASYSNYGEDIDVVAPGGDFEDLNGDGYNDGILQQTLAPDLSGFGYYFYFGTSMASPHVAGVAALLMASQRAVTPDDIRSALETTARDIGASGKDSVYGNGLIDANAALAWSSGPVDKLPSVSLTSPTDGSLVSGLIDISATASDDLGVDRVEFYIDGGLLGQDLSSPYVISYDTSMQADRESLIEARVYDSIGQSSSDFVTVVVDNINDAPLAQAGSDQVLADDDGSGFEAAVLDASGSSDSDGTIVAYEWSLGGVVIASTSIVELVVPVGASEYTLKIYDDDGASDSDTILITVNANQAPVAQAGTDQNAYIGDTIAFDASASYDPDGSIVAYAWDFGDGNTASGPDPGHVYSSVGSYVATLTVKDNGGLESQDTVAITISEAPLESLSLSVIAYKYRGRQRADLEWSGASTGRVDVYRDGILLGSTENDGFYTDFIDNRGNDGEYRYVVCEEGVLVCSNESIVSFN